MSSLMKIYRDKDGNTAYESPLNKGCAVPFARTRIDLELAGRVNRCARKYGVVPIDKDHKLILEINVK